MRKQKRSSAETIPAQKLRENMREYGDRARAGEAITVTAYGKPWFKLVAVESAK